MAREKIKKLAWLTAMFLVLLFGLGAMGIFEVDHLSSVAYAALEDNIDDDLSATLPEGSIPLRPGGKTPISEENPKPAIKIPAKTLQQEDETPVDIPENGIESSAENLSSLEETSEPVAETIFVTLIAKITYYSRKPYILWGTTVGIVAVGLFIMLLCLRRSRSKPFASKPAMQVKESIQIANIQGIGAREEQQDSFGVTDVMNLNKGVFAVVADGMGGVANGMEISRAITSNMLNIFQSFPSDAYDPVTMLLGMVTDTQEKVRMLIEQHGNELSGSTVVAAIINNDSLHFVSVGDSRIYLWRGDALVLLNREHNCATYLDEQAARGEISLAEARNTPQRAALTSFIGLDGHLQIDNNATPVKLKGGDRVVLMSDGVFATLSEDELADALSNPSIYAAGSALENAVIAKNNQNQDNFTAVIIGNF